MDKKNLERSEKKCKKEIEFLLEKLFATEAELEHVKSLLKKAEDQYNKLDQSIY